MPATEAKIFRPDAPWIKDEPEDFPELTEADLELMTEEIADKAMISAVKTITELSRNQDLQAYSRHPKILSKFQAVKTYKTELCFGIHVGYAIEGSIGTPMKVDALYLSSDLQIAHRVQQLNTNYDTQILITGDFYDLLSQKGQSQVRQIDNVFIYESQNQPLQLWSFDIKPVDPLVEIDLGEDDEAMNINEERVTRPIGVYIEHEDFKVNDE